VTAGSSAPAAFPVWLLSGSTVSVQCRTKGMFQNRIEGKFVGLLVSGSCHVSLGQRSFSSTHSSLRHLYESGEFHVPDHFTPVFVTSLVIGRARHPVWMQRSLFFCQEWDMKCLVVHQ